MTTQEIANKLYELCAQNQYEQAQNELYAEGATSTELNMGTGAIDVVTGMEAIKEKGNKFREMIVEMHGGYVNPPSVFGNNIFLEMGMDVTMKNMPRMEMKEMCHYAVKDGKIISERFYY